MHYLFFGCCCVAIALCAIIFFTFLHCSFCTCTTSLLYAHYYDTLLMLLHLFFPRCYSIFFTPTLMFFTHYLATPFALHRSSSHVVSLFLCCYGVFFTLSPYSSLDVVLFFLHCPCYSFCTMLIVFFMLFCCIIVLLTLPFLWSWCSTFRYLLGQFLMLLFSHYCY
jgi:hypothetical protein